MHFVVMVLALVVTAKVALAAEMTTTLAIKNMYCATCPITVRQAIAKVPGVKTVSVDFRKKRATVTFDDARTTVDTLAAASRDAGFPAERKE